MLGVEEQEDQHSGTKTQEKTTQKHASAPDVSCTLFNSSTYSVRFVVCSVSRAFLALFQHIYTQKAYPMRISVVLFFFVEVVTFDPHSILGAKSKQHWYPSNIYKNRWRSRCVCGVVT